MKKTILAAAAVAALVAGTAIAQQQMPGDHGGKPHGWARMLEKVDTNRDGAISVDEAMAAAKARFTKTDANNDGKITEQEAMAWREQHMGRMKAHAAGGPGPDGGPEGWRGRGRGGPGGMVARLDRDGDGRLTRAEFDAPFDRMDTNRDGVVDAAEMQAARQMMMERMRDRPGADTQ